MSKWQDKSNEEINIAVTGHRFNCSKWTLSDDKKSFFLLNRGEGPDRLEVIVLDYCCVWGFAGPLIHENGICLADPETCGLDGEWRASKFYSANCGNIIGCDNKNPLRAAMIVYLEMNGVQPNE